MAFWFGGLLIEGGLLVWSWGGAEGHTRRPPHQKAITGGGAWWRPLPPGWLLLRAYRIRLECILVLFYFHRFTLADMKNGVVIYEHDGGVNFQDSFKFTVKVENIPLEGNVKIRILSESHTDPPHIINNNVITVDENSVTAITDEDLQVCVVIIFMQNNPIEYITM